jgi:hypothetical protein
MSIVTKDQNDCIELYDATDLPGEDEIDEEERRALDNALDDASESIARGEAIPAEEVMRPLKDVKFLVDAEGKATAVVLDMAAWSALLNALEDTEDVCLARERLLDWKTKRRWTAWEQNGDLT